MAQAREKAFNPPSPHSSTGGADSYKQEGTPDTRLTAFSPDESSVRSARLIKPVGLGAPEPVSLQFPAGYNHGYDSTSVMIENDPFVSSTPSGKPDQKLSATASTFHPFSTSLIARGSNVPPLSVPANLGAHRVVHQRIGNLSADLGISRYLVVTSTIRNFFLPDVEMFLAVSYLCPSSSEYELT